MTKKYVLQIINCFRYLNLFYFQNGINKIKMWKLSVSLKLSLAIDISQNDQRIIN